MQLLLAQGAVRRCACGWPSRAAHSQAPQNAKAVNSDGNTPLHWACLNGHAPVASALLAAGARASHLNAALRTPVDEAQAAGEAGAACLAAVYAATGGGGTAAEEVDDVEEEGDALQDDELDAPMEG